MIISTFNALGTNKEIPANARDSRIVDATVARRGPLFNKMLVGENTDIMGMQEIRPCWQEWATGGHLPEAYAFSLKTTVESNEGGLIVYKRDKFTILDDNIFWLVEGAPTETAKIPESHFDRMCHWVLFKNNENGQIFIFADTHIDTVEQVKVRQCHVLVDTLLSIKAQKEKELGVACPLILTGDMNSRPETEMYRVLTEKLFDSRLIAKEDTCGNRLASSPDFHYVDSASEYRNDGHIIDFILLSEGAKVGKYWMIDTAYNICSYGPHISDHNAVYAEIDF